MPAGRHRIAQMFWGAMLFAVGIYYAILLGLGPSGKVVLHPPLLERLRMIFLAAAAAHTLAVWFLHRRYLAPMAAGPSGLRDAPDPQRRFAILVVCWALGEAIALYGLVLGMMGRVEVVFFPWTVGVLFALRPRADYFPAVSVSSQPR